MDILKRFASIIFFLVTFVLLCKVFLLNYFIDFNVYYESARTFLQGGNPYIQGQNHNMVFLYPPIMLPLFSLFLLSDKLFIGKLWILLSMLFLVLSLHFVYKLYNRKFTSNECLVLSGFVFLSFPVKFTLGMGQINLFILLLLTLSCYSFVRKKNTFASIITGLAIVLKLMPLLLLPYLMIKRKWKIFFTVASVIILVMLISLLFVHVTIAGYYMNRVLPSFSANISPYYFNQALSGFITRIIADNRLRIFFIYLVSLLFLMISSYFVLKQKKKKINDLDFSLVITLNLLINSFSWQHHFSLLILPFLIVYFHIVKIKKNQKLYGCLLLSFFLVNSNIKTPALYNGFIQSHVFFGAFVLWALILYMIRYENK